MDKKQARLKRALKTRILIRTKNVIRLTVHRTPMHIYAQIISQDNSKVLASVNTLQNDISLNLPNTGNILAAKAVGQAIAVKALNLGIKNVAFDRSGFKYHGRIKALAEAARESGLSF